MNYIRYEQPLNERIRSFLRIEQLLDRFHHNIEKNTHWDIHQALLTLLELYALSTKGDLKSELMKELERQVSNLSRLSNEPEVDQEQLHELIDTHRQHIVSLRNMPGQLGQHLKNNDFFNSLRQRSSMPGGSCDFDLPLYHHWLQQPADNLKKQLLEWIQSYESIGAVINHILSILRESSQEQTVQTKNGFYQQNLDLHQPYQMVCVLIPTTADYYPEISAGKHRYSIRLMTSNNLNSRSTPLNKDIDVDITLHAV